MIINRDFWGFLALCAAKSGSRKDKQARQSNPLNSLRKLIRLIFYQRELLLFFLNVFNALRYFTKVLIPYLKTALPKYMLYPRLVNIHLLMLYFFSV